jgi:hypothetical protein
MTWARQRKLIIGGICLLIVIGAIAIPAYFFFHQQPTCFDATQNQDERGIDCGGVCARLCKNEQLGLIVEWKNTLRVSPRVYTAVAYVTNPNPRAEAKDVPYTFTVYNAANEIVATKSGKAFIPAGKHTAIIESNIISETIPTKTLFEFGTAFDWTAAKPRGDVVIKNPQASDESKSPVVTVTIANPTFKDIPEVQVIAIIYDSQGNAFAASKTITNVLKRESEQPIFFTWKEPFPRPVAQIEIIPLVP